MSRFALTLIPLLFFNLTSFSLGSSFSVNPNLIEKTLQNDMKVIFSPRVTGDLVAIRLFVPAGSMTEGSLMGSGVSHLLEHLCFKGTESGALTALAKEARKKGGTLNAYTSFMRTVYEVTYPKEFVKEALQLVSKLVLKPEFREEDLEKEKAIVEREMDMGEDDPGRILHKLFWNEAYRVAPVRYPVIGQRAILRALTLKDVKDYYKIRYQPSSMVLVVTGHFSVSNILSLIEEEYGTVPSRPLGSPQPFWEPLQQQQRHRQIVRQNQPYPEALVGWQTVSLESEDMPALDVLSMILGGMTSGLIQEELVLKGILFSGRAWSYTPALFRGVLGVKLAWQGKPVDAVVGDLETLITRLKKGRFSKEKLRSAIQRTKFELMAKIESAEGEASLLGGDTLTTGNPRYTEHWLKQIERVNRSDITRVANQYLTPTRKTIVSLVPPQFEKKESKEKQGEANTWRPEVNEYPKQRKVILTPDKTAPLVSLSWVTLGGTLAEAESELGLSALVGRLLGTRTKAKSPEALNRLWDQLGVSVSAFSGRNSIGLEATVLPESLYRFLPIFFDLIENAVFLEEDVARQKEKQKAALQAQLLDPMSRAFLELRKRLYGSHAYGRPLNGNQETLDSLSHVMAEAFWKRQRNRPNSVFSISGNFEKQALEDWLKKNPKEIVELPVKEQKHPLSNGKEIANEHTVFMPSVKQSIVLWGFPTTPMENKESLVLDFLAYALSGQASPLFSSIREEEGLAYITGASHEASWKAGHLVLYAATEPKTAPLISEKFRTILADLAKKPMERMAFEEIKNGFLGQHLRRFANPSRRSLPFALHELYGLGVHTVLERKERIQKLTPLQFQEAIQKYVLRKDPVKIVLTSSDDKSN